MAKPPPNLVEDLMLAYRTKEYPQKSPKGISFFAFVFSIFFYISIFYIFKLSPLSLLNNTKFWFFISNTLIIIIALDYGAFSSSKQKQIDVHYEEYMRHTHMRNAYQSLTQHLENPKKSITVNGQLGRNEENPDDNKLQIVTKTDLLEPREDVEKKNVIYTREAEDQRACEKPKLQKRTYGRSKSDRAKIVAFDEKKMILKRSESEKEEARVKEDNDFSTMTDEELNRRVEEFIKRFNRQIRLQAVAKLDSPKLEDVAYEDEE